MKPSVRNIKRTIKALRVIIDSTDDPIIRRMAYFAENSLRWSIEETMAWPRPEKDLYIEIGLLKDELQRTTK